MSAPAGPEIHEDEQALAAAAEDHDRRIATLLRRWPRLRGGEMRELRRIYRERMAIARRIGRLRRGR